MERNMRIIFVDHNSLKILDETELQTIPLFFSLGDRFSSSGKNWIVKEINLDLRFCKIHVYIKQID